MTAVILPFVRPASRGTSRSSIRPAARLAITPAEHQEAVEWARRLGFPWHAEWSTTGPDLAISIHTPRCEMAGDDGEELALPWTLARTEDGVVVLEDGWLERGIFSTMAAALARVLEAELVPA